MKKLYFDLTRPTLSQSRSFKIRRRMYTTKFADILILRLYNCERVGRVIVVYILLV